MSLVVWNVAGVAEFLGCSPDTIYRMVHRNEIPHLRFASGTLRFRSDDIMAWMDRHLRGAAPIEEANANLAAADAV